MAAFVKYNSFINELAKGSHGLNACTYRLALTNTAPNAASDTVWNTTVYPAPTAANGYPTGGNQPGITSNVTTAGVFKLVLVDSVFTATAGGIGPFRYAILYNSTYLNSLIGYYDYASSITLADTETFTVDFDGSLGVFTVA